MLSPTEQNDALAEIATMLMTVMPETFRTAQLDGYVLAGTSGYRLQVDEGDPEKMRRVTIPYGLDEAMRALRRGMYDPVRGTWYGFTLALSGSGQYTVDFDDERCPSASIVDDEFTRDLAGFPRAEEHIPQWLKDILANAANTFGGVRDVPDLPDPHRIADAFRAAGWGVEMNEATEFTFTTDWARLTTMNSYPIVRFGGRTDLSRIAELEAVFATLAWESQLETYDDRGRLLQEITIPAG